MRPEGRELFCRGFQGDVRLASAETSLNPRQAPAAPAEAVLDRF